MEIKEWFKLKKYPHIGLPFTRRDYKWIYEYVTNPLKIKSHSFLPLIHKSIIARKYRADKTKIVKTQNGKRMRKVEDSKERHIFYSSHLDTLIYSYYNSILNTKYESFLIDKRFKNSIVGYRRIPIAEASKKNKCNIDFAKEAFKFVIENKTRKLTVIVADITSFFDNLDHQILKSQWARVMGGISLPDDHYNIYKSLVRIKYVEGNQLFKSYSKTMLFRKGVPNSQTNFEIKRKAISKSRFFKEKNAVAFCTQSDFFKNNLNLIISKNNKYGIPQGSSISATLANIYMLDFDEQVFTKLEEFGGYYQRYSDDIIIICDQDKEHDILEFLKDKVEKLAKLNIASKKTKIYRFENVKDDLICGLYEKEIDKCNYNYNLEYLGFAFDGQKILIKNAGFSKFYRSMKRSFKKSSSLAKYSKNPDKRIFKSRLYKRFTYRGAGRKFIHRPSQTDRTKYIATKQYYWGNYLSYIEKANDSMKDLNQGNQIKRQSRKFWGNFHKLMSFHVGGN